jgi:hypothetical protein
MFSGHEGPVLACYKHMKKMCSRVTCTAHTVAHTPRRYPVCYKGPVKQTASKTASTHYFHTVHSWPLGLYSEDTRPKKRPPTFYAWTPLLDIYRTCIITKAWFILCIPLMTVSRRFCRQPHDSHHSGTRAARKGGFKHRHA